LWALFNLISASFADTSPQLQLGDSVSIFSDKAYRKNGGQYFEAVGNVVVISQTDTLYAEMASFDLTTRQIKVEGNVRVITKDMTLYGSAAEYQLDTGTAEIKNARITTSEFNVVATRLRKLGPNQFLAQEAEFTTCRDCKESWSVYGKEIFVQSGEFVRIKNGLAKIKGVDVLYIPYIVLPLTKRKSGLLFPRISSNPGEGVSLEQPFFWAISENKDATISPTFWAKRGYGGDVEYRHRFGELKWLEGSSRLLNDTIYQPGAGNIDKSGSNFFRHYSEVETHMQWTPNLNQHIHFSDVRDLDIVRDHPIYTDPKMIGSDFGLQGHLDWRQQYLTASVETNYMRNQLFDDAVKFDDHYVQVVPKASLSSVPISLLQTRLPMLQHIAIGFDSSYTRFRQVNEEESLNLRNADRVSLQPYVMWNFFTAGPVNVKTRYVLDQQYYQFENSDEERFAKNAGMFKTELSFTMDRIFGLAYEEKINLKNIPEKDRAKLIKKEEKNLVPLQKTEANSKLIGELPTYQNSMTADSIVQVRNSYRHSQEFKLIHHYIASESAYGNKRFANQIESNKGWFDYEDAYRDREYLQGANVTRTVIPPTNTMELQWNNILIRKSPRVFSYLEDDKFLRDNFSYSQIGYFKISQGYLLEDRKYADFRERLTRFYLQTGYSAPRWSVGLSEYYFHFESQNIFNLNFVRKFDYLHLLANYNYNSFANSNLNTLTAGAQVRPTDVLGFAILKDMDLEAKEDIRTIYSVDIMPHNNCYILNLNLRESLVGSRYSFNIIWNFGDETFSRYRNDYFAASQVR
jgi:LPS-assembly protein